MVACWVEFEVALARSLGQLAGVTFLLVAPFGCDASSAERDARVAPTQDAQALFPDRDGDGFGTNLSELSDAGTVRRVARSGDCLPDDPTAYPGAPDLLGDGTDANCDGHDNWTCTDDAGCACLEASDEPEPSGCDGVDLGFSLINDCWNRQNCIRTEPYRITVVNRGTQAASTVRLAVLRGDSPPVSFELGPLAALQASTVLLALDVEAHDLKLSSNTTDCAPDDNQAKVFVPRVACK